MVYRYNHKLMRCLAKCVVGLCYHVSRGIKLVPTEFMLDLPPPDSVHASECCPCIAAVSWPVGKDLILLRLYSCAGGSCTLHTSSAGTSGGMRMSCSHRTCLKSLLWCSSAKMTTSWIQVSSATDRSLPHFASTQSAVSTCCCYFGTLGNVYHNAT